MGVHKIVKSKVETGLVAPVICLFIYVSDLYIKVRNPKGGLLES